MQTYNKERLIYMNQQIKDRAKSKIKDKVIFLFLISIIPFALGSVFSAAIPFIAIFIVLIEILLNYGLNNIYLKVARLKSAVYKDIAVGFNPNELQKNLVTGLLALMWIILYTLLLIIPGIIKSYEYSQIFYVALDKPNLSSKEVLAESSRIMNGNKAKLFSLQLSFIGWGLLVLITFGLASIYVTPLYRMALTEFYLEINNDL